MFTIRGPLLLFVIIDQLRLLQQWHMSFEWQEAAKLLQSSILALFNTSVRSLYNLKPARSTPLPPSRFFTLFGPLIEVVSLPNFQGPRTSCWPNSGLPVTKPTWQQRILYFTAPIQNKPQSIKSNLKNCPQNNKNSGTAFQCGMSLRKPFFRQILKRKHPPRPHITTSSSTTEGLLLSWPDPWSPSLGSGFSS